MLKPQPLKPQDVGLALKLVIVGGGAWKQAELARSLHVSVSEVNEGLQRLALCHLYVREEKRVMRASLRDFLLHGLRYVFPAQLGIFGVGMATAHSAKPLADKLRFGADDGVVWSMRDPRFATRGYVIEPLFRSAPLAAAEDESLHEMLALADALRVGRARERQLASEEIERRLASS
jgi:hypothetical protein